MQLYDLVGQQLAAYGGYGRLIEIAYQLVTAGGGSPHRGQAQRGRGSFQFPGLHIRHARTRCNFHNRMGGGQRGTQSHLVQDRVDQDFSTQPVDFLRDRSPCR